MDDGVELADMIRQVRRELGLAMREGEGEDLRFRLGAVEVELQVALVKSTKPGVKAKLIVVDLEASRDRSLSVTHRIKVDLQPRLVGDPEQDPWVSGVPLPGEE